jgi:hypothetical protein
MIERGCVAACRRQHAQWRAGTKRVHDKRGRRASLYDLRCQAAAREERPEERSADKRAQIAVSNASVGVPARASACRRHERASAHLLQHDTHSDDLKGQGQRVQREEVLKPEVPFTTDDTHTQRHSHAGAPRRRRGGARTKTVTRRKGNGEVAHSCHQRRGHDELGKSSRTRVGGWHEGHVEHRESGVGGGAWQLRRGGVRVGRVGVRTTWTRGATGKDIQQGV